MQDSELIRQPSKSKPQMFPLRLDTRVGRLLDPNASANNEPSFKTVDTGEGEEDGGFLSKLNHAAQDLLANPLAYLSPAPQEAPSATPKPTQTEVYRNFANIMQSTSAFMSQEALAKIEQNGNQFNDERVTDPTYVDLRPYFANKNRYKIDDTTQAQLDDLEADTDKTSRGEGATLIHNASLFSKIGGSPFKKWDTNANSVLSQDAGYMALQKSSMSPNQILNEEFPGFWSSINTATQGFSTVNSAKYGQETGSNLTIEDIPDPFNDTPKAADGSRSKFDVNPNFYTLLNSGVYKTLPADQKFAFITQAAEAKRRALGMLRSMGGSIKDLFPTAADPSVDATTANEAAIQKAKVKTNQWWTTKGNTLSDTELLPYALFVDVVPTINKMSDWSSWDKGNPIGTAMIEDYLNFTQDTYVSQLQSKTLTRNLLANTSEKANGIWDQLVDKGLINSKGEILDAFKPDDPNFKLNLNVPGDEQERIKLALTNTQLGKFAIDDQSNVNNTARYDFKIKGSDGEYRSMNQILGLLKSGSTPQARIENSRKAYDYFMDIYSAMTKISTSSTSLDANKGSVISTPIENRVKADVAADAQWREMGDDGNWVTKTGPLSVEFNKAADAESFRKSIQSTIGLLEPLMSMFSSVKDANGKEIPLRILNDNSLEMTNDRPITPKDSAYRIEMDIDAPTDMLQSDIWKAFHKDIAGKITSKLGLAIPKIQIVNEGFKMQHTADVKEYKAEKEEIEQETIELLTQEAKRKAEAEAEEKKAEQEREAARQKENAENAAKEKARKEQEAAQE